jgi:hypothetical protein
MCGAMRLSSIILGIVVALACACGGEAVHDICIPDPAGQECDCHYFEPPAVPGSAAIAECDTSLSTVAVCCADEGWPANGLGCACYAITCSGGPGDCTCQVDIAGFGSGNSCSGGTCCVYASANECKCSSEACGSGGTEVASCSPDAVPRAGACGSGATSVTDCAGAGGSGSGQSL